MKTITGNWCIFSVLILIALLVFGVGVIDIVTGIYICVKSGYLNWFDVGFIVIGFILFLLVLLTCYTKKSLGKISFLFFSSVFCFLAQLILTLGVFFYSNYEKNIEHGHVDLIRYSYVGACVVLLLNCVLSYVYRRSLIHAEFNRDNDIGLKFIDIARIKEEVKKENEARI